jgi:hypothetical protein
MGQARSPMTDFWIDCYFTDSVKAERILFRLRAMPHSAELRLCSLTHSAELLAISSSNRIKLLREFESICKTVLAHESGDPGVQFDEKIRGRKSRETVPL